MSWLSSHLDAVYLSCRNFAWRSFRGWDAALRIDLNTFQNYTIYWYDYTLINKTCLNAFRLTPKAYRFFNVSEMQNALETLQKCDICKRMVLRLLKCFRNTFETHLNTHLKHIVNAIPRDPHWVYQMDLLNFAGGSFQRTKVCGVYPPAERGFNFWKMPIF